jgi:hypothetical protein
VAVVAGFPAQTGGKPDRMPALLAPIILLLAGVAAFFFGGIWGIPIIIVAIILFVVLLMAARKKDPTAATWETGKGIEPTGTPRSSPGGAETTNQRVGQS